jgi:oxygen-dependent protoporphyrinogen oxidase
LFPRLVDAERQTGSVIRAMRALHIKPSPQGAFVSLPGGVGELVETLAATLAPGTISVESAVGDLRRVDGYSVTTSTGTVHARAVVLAVPAYVAGRLLRSFDTSLGALCEAVPYASTATVAFGYRRDQIGREMRGSGFVVPRVEQSPLLAATWVTSKWPGRAPDGHVLLRGFLGGGRDPRRLEESDEALIDLARESLREIMNISGEPLFARLFRWTRQSPQYDVGHLARVAAITERAAAIPGLYLTGSGFRAIGIPDCIADGRDAGARAAAYVTAKSTTTV